MISTCEERLIRLLTDNQIPFQSLKHHQAYTAQEIAAEQKVPGNQLAKVVMVKAEDQMAMLVIPATHRVNFRKLAEVLGCPEVRLAEEKEFSGLFLDCYPGAMPPFGNLYHIPVYVDRSLTEDPEIVFNAGTHSDTLKIRYADYARLVSPLVAEFAVHM